MAESQTGELAAVDSETMRERMQALLEHCELTNVHLIKMSAERFGPGTPTSATISSGTEYLVTDGQFANKVEWDAKLTDEDDLIAVMSATFLVEYQVFEGFVVDEEAAEEIAVSTGFFAAYPYVREFFQATCGRLQLDPLVLGMLLAGATEPRGISSPARQR